MICSAVNDLFTRCAPTYDLVNDLMSFGMHRLWKRKLVKHMVAHADLSVIADVASGTMDMTTLLLRQCGQPVLVLACDPNKEMLARGMLKMCPDERARVSAVVCSAERLVLPRGLCSTIVTAFGPRNFNDLSAGLAEIYRTLKSGGMFFSLELFTARGVVQRVLYRGVGRHYIRCVGKLFRLSDVYDYLVRSIDGFEVEAYLDAATGVGFKVRCEVSLTPFTAVIHGFYKD